MNGCDVHMETAEPGCHDCFHRLIGRYDAQKSETKRLGDVADRANAAMLKHQKHNGALEIAIQEAHRDTDVASRQVDLLSKGILENTTYPEPLINGSAVETAIALLKDRQEKIRLISTWQEYAAFLGVEVGSLSLFAAIHGWKCPPETVAKGSELRRKLGVNDDWTLIEKRKDESPYVFCLEHRMVMTDGVCPKCCICPKMKPEDHLPGCPVRE